MLLGASLLTPTCSGKLHVLHRPRSTTKLHWAGAMMMASVAPLYDACKSHVPFMARIHVPCLHLLHSIAKGRTMNGNKDAMEKHAKGTPLQRDPPGCCHQC